MSGLLTVEEALAAILERARPLPTENVAVAAASGRVVREPALALVDLPPFASSAMDGFAVRAQDTPGDLPVAFRIAAGRPAPTPLPPGCVAAIATGGVVPEGADAIVPVEHALDRGDHVVIQGRVDPGRHVRPRGGDVRTGDTVVPAAARVHPAQLGALAATGVAEIRCSVRPRVAVLATGTELRPAGEMLAPGQIYESNRAMIAAVLTAAGAEVQLLPVVEDDETAHRAALEQGLVADVLVTSGGVSIGPHDLVRRVASELDVEEVFWGVAVKPGKPLSFGVRRGTLVFGVPGNPVSSLVSALVFVRPAVLALQGMEILDPGYEPGWAASPFRRNPQRDEFVRARRRIEREGVLLEAVSGQDSHMIVRASSADALVHVPCGDGEIGVRDSVRYLSLD